MHDSIRPTAIVAGAGLAGLGLGRLLAWRGWQVCFLHAAREPSPDGADWLLVPASLVQQLPPPTVIDSALAVDLVLPGDWRLELPARLALVDRRVLVDAWRRRARSSGVTFLDGSSVRGPLRAKGRTAGVVLQDGSEIAADLTVDGSGRGALLGALSGCGLRARRFEMTDREPVAMARVDVRPEAVQSAWAGRAQLLMDVDRPGAMAWRVVPRRGTGVYAAATAGPGATRGDSEDVLGRVLGPLDARATVSWHPCRRPLDVISSGGVLAVGGAAAATDSLIGLSLPFLLATATLVDDALAGIPRGSVRTEDLFGVTSRFQRTIGASLAVRSLIRRFLHGLAPEHRESVLVSRALGPRVWYAAVTGGDPTVPLLLESSRASGLPGGVRGRFVRLVRQCGQVRLHHARYPRHYDVFELDRWQARIEALFASEPLQM